jgi:hypothetical protein
MTRLYILLILILPALSVGVYGTAIWHIDPYGFYKPMDRGMFPIKPDMVTNQNMVKAQIVRKIQPDKVIIGSSRVDYAIDPDHPYFEGKDVYNFGLKGIRVPELYATVKHAYYSGARDILWGLDFFSFNAYMDQRPDFSTTRLYDGTNNPDRDLKTLISISSLKPALKTLIRQSNPETPHTRLNGQHAPGELDKKTRERGVQSLFDNNAFVFLSKVYFPTPHRKYSFTDTQGEDTWTMFEKTLRFIKDKDMKVTFFIAPQHAYQHSMVYQSGLFEMYKTWKMRLAEMLEDYNFDVRDYTAISAITTESIPAGTGQSIQYYWESSHYKPIIGDMIMDDLMNKRSPLQSTSITDINIDQFERDLIAYQCRNQDIVNDIRAKIINAGLENRLIPALNCR